MIVVGVVAACAPSQAVVSTIKLPFLSWHLSQTTNTKSLAIFSSRKHYIQVHNFVEPDKKPDRLTCETISAPASIEWNCRADSGARPYSGTAPGPTARMRLDRSPCRHPSCVSYRQDRLGSATAAETPERRDTAVSLYSSSNFAPKSPDLKLQH